MIEDDEARAIFFSSDDFAEEVAVTPTDGAPFTLTAIFDAHATTDNPGYNGAQMSGSNPQIRCRSSEFPVALVGQCTVTVRAQDYNVYDVKPDSTGVSKVILKRK